MNELGGPQNCARQSHSADVMCQISQGLRARAPDNVADGEADQTVKPITPPHTFRLVFSFLRDDLLLSYFYFIHLAPNVLNALPLLSQEGIPFDTRNYAYNFSPVYNASILPLRRRFARYELHLLLIPPSRRGEGTYKVYPLPRYLRLF